MTSVQPYAERVAVLTKAYLARRSREPVTDLLSALGCCHLKPKFPFSHMVDPAQPPRSDESLVRRTLVAALRSHVEKDGVRDDGFAILEGLSRNERWRECLSTTDDAYNLSLLLLDFISSVEIGETDSEKARFLVAVKPGACSIFYDWVGSSGLGSDTPFGAPELPTCMQVCRALFGSAWCDLVLCPPGTKFWNDRGMISTHKPPFRPGLLPDHLDQHAAPLPDMDLP